jgi:hypothetical protein
LEDLGVDGRVLNCIFKKWDWRKVDWIELAQDRLKYTDGGKIEVTAESPLYCNFVTVNHKRTPLL